MATQRTARRTAAGVAALGALCWLAAGARPADEGVSQVETARVAIEKMVETRRLISREKRDWALGKEILEDRLEIVQDEIDALRRRIEEAESSIADADRKRAELVEDNEQLKQASTSLVAIVEQLEQRTRSLVARLPGPLAERVAWLSQRLPEPEAETKLSLSERFQNVVGILNASNRFNREITPSSEVRTLSEGKTAEVTALYVGLGQAYYVTANGESAGVGTVGADGWTWEPADAAAPAIAETISILKGEKPAAFVRLPVRIQ